MSSEVGGREAGIGVAVAGGQNLLEWFQGERRVDFDKLC